MAAERDEKQQQQRYEELAHKAFILEEDMTEEEGNERMRLWFNLHPEEQWWHHGNANGVTPDEMWPKNQK